MKLMLKDLDKIILKCINICVSFIKKYFSTYFSLLFHFSKLNKNILQDDNNFSFVLFFLINIFLAELFNDKEAVSATLKYLIKDNATAINVSKSLLHMGGYVLGLILFITIFGILEKRKLNRQINKNIILKGIMLCSFLFFPFVIIRNIYLEVILFIFLKLSQMKSYLISWDGFHPVIFSIPLSIIIIFIPYIILIIIWARCLIKFVLLHQTVIYRGILINTIIIYYIFNIVVLAILPGIYIFNRNIDAISYRIHIDDQLSKPNPNPYWISNFYLAIAQDEDLNPRTRYIASLNCCVYRIGYIDPSNKIFEEGKKHIEKNEYIWIEVMIPKFVNYINDPSLPYFINKEIKVFNEMIKIAAEMRESPSYQDTGNTKMIFEFPIQYGKFNNSEIFHLIKLFPF